MRLPNLILTSLLLARLLTWVPEASADQDVKEGRRKYDVAAFVWPSYHPDNRAKIFWPDGIGEWQTVASNKPKYAGHEQPRRPLWGYINEADPYVAEMEIAAAADHGVNVFIFDWYWYDGMPYLEGHLNDGYLKARNNDRVKFYLMWANHDVGMGWDKRNADAEFSGKNSAKIWEGGIDRQEFEKIARRMIERYFSHPSYYRISGKPILMIYELRNFIEGLGGIKGAQQALDWFRREVRKAGFPGLELQLSMRREDASDASWESDGTKYLQKDLLRALGFDSLTHYQFGHFLDVDRDYVAVAKDAAREWNSIADTYDGTYYPHVSVGWDANPRTYEFVGPVMKNSNPENFEAALREAKDFADAHPQQAPLITVNSWNEWTETSYLQPCDKYGYGYLEAVKRVFLDQK